MIDVKNISKTFISHSTEVKALVNVTARIESRRSRRCSGAVRVRQKHLHQMPQLFERC